MEDLVLIARIRRPHGVRGELALESFTHDDRRFAKLDRVFLRNKKGDLSEYHVKNTRIVANGVLISFKEIADRTAAEELHGMEMLIPESERLPMAEGKAYFDQIIGMKVIDDETNEELGEVTNIYELPAGDMYEFRLQDGSKKLVTSAGEEVRSLDVAANSMRVKLLEDY